jgi:NAD-dependent deacetylase
VGTSLVVYPAAGLLQYFRGKWLVLINRDPTPADASANLVIHDKVGEVLSCIKVN